MSASLRKRPNFVLSANAALCPQADIPSAIAIMMALDGLWTGFNAFRLNRSLPRPGGHADLAAI